MFVCNFGKYLEFWHDGRIGISATNPDLFFHASRDPKSTEAEQLRIDDPTSTVDAIIHRH